MNSYREIKNLIGTTVLLMYFPLELL